MLTDDLHCLRMFVVGGGADGGGGGGVGVAAVDAAVESYDCTGDGDVDDANEDAAAAAAADDCRLFRRYCRICELENFVNRIVGNQNWMV